MKKQINSDLKIYSEVKYGQLRLYPDCNLSSQLVNLLKQKTFTPEQLKEMYEIGFRFEFKGGREAMGKINEERSNFPPFDTKEV